MSVIILISISKIVTIVLVLPVRGEDHGKAQNGQLGKQCLQKLPDPLLLSRKMQEVFRNADHELTSKNVGLWNITFRVVVLFFWGGKRD